MEALLQRWQLDATEARTFSTLPANHVQSETFTCNLTATAAVFA